MNWTVLVYSADSIWIPVRIEVEANDRWRAVIAAGRTGLVPLDVTKIEVYSR